MPYPDDPTNRRPNLPPFVKTGYGEGGGVSTGMGLRGVDIGNVPDFWGDLDALSRRIKPTMREPQATAPVQAQAMRAPAPEGDAAPSMLNRATRPDLSQRTARSFGTPSMSPQGVMGTLVNPLDIPAELVGQVPTGFFSDSAASNYTYSPTVNPTRWATGRTQRAQAY